MVLQLCYLVNNFTQWHAKIDLNFIITSPHYKMDFGRGDVLGILTCPLQNGCTTGTYTLCSERASSQGCLPTSGVPGYGTGQDCTGLGHPDLSLQAGVVWVTPTAWEGVLCVCLCMFALVTEGSAEIWSCMWLVAGLWLSVVADIDPECIVQDY